MKSSKIMKWKFKINQLTPDRLMAIGIDESNTKYVDSCFYNKKGAYSYCSNGNAYNNGNQIKKYGSKFGLGSVITMIFNTSSGSLSFEIAKEEHTWYGTSKGIKKGSIKKFDPIQVKDMSKTFTMAISILNNGDSVSLLSSTCDSIDTEQTKQEVLVCVCDRYLTIHKLYT